MLYALFAFVVLQIVVGVVAARSIRTEDDYLLAGRRVGPLLATTSIFATWFGAESCMAAAGSAYTDGITAMSTEPLAYGACLVLMGLVFAGRFWRLRITTLPDYFRQRFGPLPERLAALILLPSSLLWAAAQVRAFGHIVADNSAGALGLETAIGIAAAVAVVYTLCGGLLADIYTDLFQGGMLVVGLVALALAVGPAIAGDTTAPEPTPTLPAWTALDLAEAWAIPICGSILAQEALSRSLAARSGHIARNAAVLGGLLYVLVGLLPLSLGAMAPRLLPDLAEPESVLLQLSSVYLPAALRLMFLGALVAAILSTVDSCLLVASSLAARNLLPHRAAGAPTSPRLARIACALAGCAAYGLATSGADVGDLVHEASGFGSAGVFVLGLFGLFSRLGTAVSACLTLACGCGTWIVGCHVWPDLVTHPYLTSLAAAALGFLLGCAWDRCRPERLAGLSSGTR